MDIKRNTRGRRCKLSPEQIEELVKYYLDGLKIADIAALMGVSVSTVTRVMRLLREQEEQNATND